MYEKYDGRKSLYIKSYSYLCYICKDNKTKIYHIT